MSRGRQSISIANEAFGLNQLIAPLFDLVLADLGALVGIEEPEIHLHPRAQATLAELFVEFATTREKQLLLTTHSEHILMGLLGAVAAGRLRAGDLAVYELYREDDAARARRLEVNEYGQIQGGLREFLEVDFDKVGELVAAHFR
jgi:predicted ATPase